MKKSILFTVVIASYICIAAAPTITGVMAQQRYSWKGLGDNSINVTGIGGTTNVPYSSVSAVTP